MVVGIDVEERIARCFGKSGKLKHGIEVERIAAIFAVAGLGIELGEGVRLPDRTAIGVPVFLRIDARGVGAVARIHSAVCRARKKDAPVEAICRAPIAAKLQAEGFRDRSAHDAAELVRSEEHTSELQSLMRISYALFC